MKTWIKRSMLAAGLATALASTGVMAQGMQHGGMGGKGGGGRMMERAEALRKDLALTESQQALWDIAMNKSKTTKQTAMQSRRQSMEQTRAQLATGNADLRALAAQMDTQRDAAKAQQQDVRNAWLNLYDKLDANQRAKVNAMLSQMMERRGRMGEQNGGGPK
jgi:Spy/CpxP family protein refolding chaperone